MVINAIYEKTVRDIEKVVPIEGTPPGKKESESVIRFLLAHIVCSVGVADCFVNGSRRLPIP